MTFNSDFVVEPLKNASPHLIKVVKERFTAIAPQTNPYNEDSLRKAGSYCIAPLIRTLPRAVVVAVKSNIIEEIKKAANIPLVS